MLFVCIRPIFTNLCPLFPSWNGIVPNINRALTSVNLLKNDLGDGAAAVVAAAKQQGNIKTLCGIEEGQTEVKLRRSELKAPDAVLLSFDLEFNRALTSLDLYGNEIGASGAEAIAAALPQSYVDRLDA